MTNEYAAGVKKNKENKAILKGTMVRDGAVCNECNYQRCIYSKYVKGSMKYDITKQVQEEHWEASQQ